MDKAIEWFWIDLFVLFDVKAENRGNIKDYAVCFVEQYSELFITKC